MTLIPRDQWGAAPPRGRFTPADPRGRGTIHYSASPITPAAAASTMARPEKPGPKWYRLWRSKATPVTQRRNISRAIRRYNEALRTWKAGQAVPPALAAAERAVMRSIQAFHQGPARGWLDIGYHRVIFATGNVYEGRPLGVFGAHAVGANDTVGYCFVMGPGDQPTHQMLNAFNLQRHADEVTSIAGHRQRPGNSTSCPGDPLTRALGL